VLTSFGVSGQTTGNRSVPGGGLDGLRRVAQEQNTVVKRSAAGKFGAFRKTKTGIPIREADTFILAVTADMSSGDKANELERQAKRFRKLGVRLVVHDIQGEPGCSERCVLAAS